MKNKLTLLLLILLTLNACSDEQAERKKKYEEEKTSAEVPFACDTTNIRYNQVADIIDEKCALCHNPNIPSGGVILTSREQLIDQIKNGKLIPAIKHEVDVTPMPPGNPIDPCYIAQIESWIAAGFPDSEL